MLGRTDLAMEAAADVLLGEEDIAQSREVCGKGVAYRMEIRSERAAAAVGKPRGKYVTVQLPSLSDDETDLDEEAVSIARQLRLLLPPTGTVLIVGLGNRTVTPDALGPTAAEMVLATRHIHGEFARAAGLEDLRPTAVLSPGVLGQTGTESGEIVRGVCREVKPAAVIVIDALAARDPARLGNTVQLCDTGIAPGSGVGNNRHPLDRSMLGVPVIGIGVPTVVDAASLVRSYLEEPLASPPPRHPVLMVTPREIDLVISRAARLVAMSINRALQPGYSPLQLTAIARSI